MTYSYKKIKLPVFECDVHVVVGTDPTSYLEKHNIPIESLYGAAAITVWDEDNSSSVHVILHEDVGYDTIAHEAVHCINKIFLAKHVKPDFDNDEIYAYHVGWLSGEIAEFFGKLNKKRENNNK